MTRPALRRTAPGLAPHRLAHGGPGLPTLGLALVAALSAAGCDNPACVFSPTQCQPGAGGGGPGGLGSLSAVFPNDASWMAAAAPTVVRFAPEILDAHPQTPLIIEFDLSLDPASLSRAFEVLDSLTLTPVPLLDPPALVGNGRVVVLTFPTVGTSSPLVPGSTYLVRFTDDQEIADVTGQAFDFGTGQDIFEFGVSESPSAVPRVIYSYPADDSIQASDLTDVVVAFDRRMLGTSFSSSSFVVTGGETLVPPPAPSTLILTGLQTLQSVLQVWLWSNTASSGARQSLGADANVRVRLSPAGNPLLADGAMGGTLPQTDIEFRTALVRAPTSVRKVATALPLDAIGVPNLGAGSGVLEVTFADDAGPNDTLEVFIIGGSPANPQLLKAEQRTVPVPAGAASIVLGEAELDLREPSGVARFRDGEIEFMARVRRGTSATVARRTDGDMVATGFQRLVLDLTPPQLLGLGVAGTNVTLVRSELGGIVMVGRGDEEIHYARVTSMIRGGTFTNVSGPADPPPVALSSAGGRFIATPVVGVPYLLDPADAVDYTVEVFDRALNPAVIASALGRFEQIGSVGPAPQVNTGVVTVRVFDADTGAPLDGARVMSHSDDGSVLTDLDFGLTVGGVAMVPAAGVGLETVVTVQLSGYDSFTFHGVPVERFDVPLPRTGAPAMIRGVVRRALNPAVLTNTNWIGDNRTIQPGSPLTPATAWVPNATGQLECNYGPFTVRPHRLGLTTFFSTDPNQQQGTFNPSLFLTGTALRLTDDALAYGTNAVGQDLTISTVDIGVLIPPAVLDVNGVGPFTPSNTPPIITVEGVAPGLEGAPTLGIGTTYAKDMGEWFVVGATPSTTITTLVGREAVEPSLHLRAEVVDVIGNRIGTRPQISATGGLLTPIGVPNLLTPAPMGLTGGDAYSIEVDDVIPDAVAPATLDGLYRVVISDSTGRRWHLWALDQPAKDVVRLALPPVAALGGTPLADGLQTARVSAWAWPDLDRTQFLWADVERRHELFAHAFATQFTQN